MGDRDIRNDPKTYDEAMLDVDSERWMEAMKSEIDSIHSNQILTLVDTPEGTTRKESFYEEFIDDGNIFITNKTIYDQKLNSSLIMKYL